MPRAIKILIEGDDPTDLDWIKDRVINAVEETVDENRNRFDGEVSVIWEWID